MMGYIKFGFAYLWALFCIAVRSLAWVTALFALNAMAFHCFAGGCDIRTDKFGPTMAAMFIFLEALVVILGPIFYFGIKIDARDEQKSKEW